MILTNKYLIRRLVSDYDLPFPVVSDKDPEYNKYMLNLIPGAKEKAELMEDTINNKHNGDPGAFLDDYDKVKSGMIDNLKKRPEFVAFNTGDMKKWIVSDRPEGLPAGSPHNFGNLGKTLLSVDLKEANFQALKLGGVFSADETYESIIESFTDSKYIIDCKHFRNVVFGQLNPSRHITVERWMTNQIRKVLSPLLSGVKLISQREDELVWEILDPSEILLPDIPKVVSELLGWKVRAEVYTLSGYTIARDITSKKIEFFSKTMMGSGEVKYKSIPSKFFPLVWKYMNNLEPEDYDYLIEHDGMIARLMFTPKIEKVG